MNLFDVCGAFAFLIILTAMVLCLVHGGNRRSAEDRPYYRHAPYDARPAGDAGAYRFEEWDWDNGKMN